MKNLELSTFSHTGLSTFILNSGDHNLDVDVQNRNGKGKNFLSTYIIDCCTFYE